MTCFYCKRDIEPSQDRTHLHTTYYAHPQCYRVCHPDEIQPHPILGQADANIPDKWVLTVSVIMLLFIGLLVLVMKYTDDITR